MNSIQSPKLIALSMITISILTILLVYVIIGFSNALQTTYYKYSNSKIPIEFNDYRIVQISDYHCKDFGKDEDKFIETVASLKPDIIVLTGDMIDGNHRNLSPIEHLLQAISQIAPIYSVSGNHEFDDASQYTELLNLYDTYGIINLDQGQTTISRNGSSITLYGLSANRMDVLFNRSVLPTVDPSSFSIVLYHYSNQFYCFKDYGFDLILSGHTHGGIIRLPFVGGLIDHKKGFFPKYDGGEYTLGPATMISSRGLGDTILPRFYNRPELVCITLNPTE